MKQCTKCLLMLPSARFATLSANRGRSARLASWCNDCTNHCRAKPAQLNPQPLAAALANWSKR